MPRKDRTYTDRDVIRIIRNHLTGFEVAKVLLEVCRGVKIEIFDGEAILVPLSVEESTLEEVDLIEDVATGLATAGVSGAIAGILEVISSIFD